MAKQLMFDADGWAKVQSGVRKIADAVKVTLGPSGKNVLLEKKWGSPVSTRDGVTVAREIELPDPFENMGAKLVNEVASKTSDTAGDGTTTATVLAQRLFSEGLKAVVAGANPMAVKRGMDAAVARVVEEIKGQSRPIRGAKNQRELIVQVGTISANQDRVIGELLADKGFVSPYFSTAPQSPPAALEDAYDLVP